jgi:hypothetical protein
MSSKTSGILVRIDALNYWSVANFCKVEIMDLSWNKYFARPKYDNHSCFCQSQTNIKVEIHLMWMNKNDLQQTKNLPRRRLSFYMHTDGIKDKKLSHMDKNLPHRRMLRRKIISHGRLMSSMVEYCPKRFENL